jgi:YidC/Oxa1 family membrane protein insertase
MAHFLKAFRAIRAFNRLGADTRALTFYAEGSHDWPHLGPLVERLVNHHGSEVCYFTSQADDPVLTLEWNNLRAFYIGTGLARTWLFQTLSARMLVLTLPDLNSFHLKRSVNPVHYAYIYHSINSTHMVYREAAFDAYDTVFCVGPHHVEEIRAREKQEQLPPKKLIEHGYARLDALLQEARQHPQPPPSADAPLNILLAPSWGIGSFIERDCGTTILEHLLKTPHQITLRFHPMTTRRFPKLKGELEAQFSWASDFVVETDVRSRESLINADILISDWSGTSFEFAFAFEKPVIFIDTPPKENNPAWQQLGLPPLEMQAREELGEVVPEDQPERVIEAVNQIRSDRPAYIRSIQQLRDRIVFNPESSTQAATEALLLLEKELAQQPAKLPKGALLPEA